MCIEERGQTVRQRRCEVAELPDSQRKGLGAKECRQPLDAGKGDEMDSPLEPQERLESCQYLDFHLVKLILDF